MILDLDYITGHVRGELGRGHVRRCPLRWLMAVRSANKGTDLAAACQIAIDVHKSGTNHNPREREMRKLAGRRLA